MKFQTNRILKKIILLAVLLFGAFFIVWVLHIAQLYDLDENVKYESFTSPYSIIQ